MTLTPLKAIKEKCKNDCCGGDREEWKHCPVISCALYPFRLGHNEKMKGHGNPQNLIPKKKTQKS